MTSSYKFDFNSQDLWRAFIAEIKANLTTYTQPYLDILTTVPRQTQYPIEWTTERQRKAFFATDGFGRGIPTFRTGQAATSWISEIQQLNNTTALLRVVNTVEYSGFVFGVTPDNMEPQQQFHSNTGWLGLDIASARTVQVTNLLTKAWENF